VPPGLCRVVNQWELDHRLNRPDSKNRLLSGRFFFCSLSANLIGMDPGFPVWKKITLGTFENVEELKAAIVSKGFRIGSWAEDVLNGSGFSLLPIKREVGLVRITPRELGFANGAYRLDVYRRAFECGLEICLPEVGPQLRLQYSDQPPLESLQIGMEAHVDSLGHPVPSRSWRRRFRVAGGGS